MKKKIYYATGNTGKLDEVKRFLEQHNPNIELKQLSDELTEIQTMDQQAIAVSKAEQAWNILKQPVLVDDAGIYFDAYNNFPGTLTKFIYHGIGYKGLLKLVEDNNRATFKLFMIYKDADEGHETFEGICEGKIICPESYDAPPGLPYDAIFLPNGSDKTYAQLRGTAEEYTFAYRLKALKSFLTWFER